MRSITSAASTAGVAMTNPATSRTVSRVPAAAPAAPISPASARRTRNTSRRVTPTARITPISWRRSTVLISITLRIETPATTSEIAPSPSRNVESRSKNSLISSTRAASSNRSTRSSRAFTASRIASAAARASAPESETTSACA